MPIPNTKTPIETEQKSYNLSFNYVSTPNELNPGRQSAMHKLNEEDVYHCLCIHWTKLYKCMERVEWDSISKHHSEYL